MTCWASCCCTRYETRLELHKALIMKAVVCTKVTYLLPRAGVKHIHDVVEQRNIRFLSEIEKNLVHSKAQNAYNERIAEEESKQDH